MKNELARLRALAVRVRNGDQAAAAELLRELEPRVRRIVRHVIHRGTASSPLAERILREAGRISGNVHTVVTHVTRLLCQSLLDHLRTPTIWSSLKDTMGD